MPDPAGRPLVVALVTNLFFAAPIGDAAKAAGAEALIVESAAALAAAIQRVPALIAIDLAVQADWQPIVRHARQQPETRAIPIVAFGSHVEGEALRSARAAGCNHAWARSRFMAELPELVRRAAQEAGRSPADRHDPPPEPRAFGARHEAFDSDGDA
jgi:CheY-like chemotaxis protein